MTNTILLLIVLTILLFFSSKRNGKIWFTPEIGVYFGFILSVTGFLINSDKWGTGLSSQAFMVFIVGFASIFIASAVSESLFNIKKEIGNVESAGETINVNTYRISIWLLFQIIIATLVSLFLRSEFSVQSLVDSIGEFRDANLLNKEGLKLPFFIRISRSMCIYSGYLFIYLFVRHYSTNTKTTNSLLSSNILVSMFLSCIVGGSRGEIFRYIIAGVAIALFNALIQKRTIKIRKMAIIFIIGSIISVVLFLTLFPLLGRGEISEKDNAILTYLSGSIANFDYYVNRANYFQEDRNGTFISFERMKSQIWKKQIKNEDRLGRQILYDTYNSFNGHDTGNVYTMFASYYHDIRIFGVIIFSMLFVFLGEYLLYLAIKHEKANTVNVFIIMYGYLFFDYTQSFFSNRFYPDLFSDNYLKFIIFLFLFSRLITRNNAKEESLISKMPCYNHGTSKDNIVYE